MTALVLAVIFGLVDVSAIDPATTKMPRWRASSRMAPRVGPSSVSAPARRASSGPMKPKFSGRPTSLAPRSAASFRRRRAVSRFFARSAVEVIWTAPMR